MSVRFPRVTWSKLQLKPLAVRPAPIRLPAKPLLFSLDVDKTLIPWKKEPQYDEVALKRYTHVLNNPIIQENSFLLLNTGRGLRSTLTLIPLLSQFNVDALGLNDGQQLFLKNHSPDRDAKSTTTTAKWLNTLQAKEEDPHWKAELNGWSTAEVMHAASQEFAQLGFMETLSAEAQEGLTHTYIQHPYATKKDSPAWLLKFHPGQAYMELTCTDGKANTQEIADFADQIGLHLQQALQPTWPNATYYINPTSKRSYIHLGPAGNSKGSLVHHLVEQRFESPPSAVISAGDTLNDRDILSAEHFGETPNYPIQVGSHPPLMAHLAKKRPTHLEQAELGQLDTGLKAQLAKLQDKLPFLKPKTPPTTPTSTEKKLERFA